MISSLIFALKAPALMNELVEAQRVEQDVRPRPAYTYDDTDAPPTAPRFVIFSFLFTFSAVCLHFITWVLFLE